MSDKSYLPFGGQGMGVFPKQRDTLQRGAERLGRSFVSPPDGKNCISVKPWVIDMIAADPGIRSLVELAKAAEADRGPWAKRARVALRKWEKGE